MPRHPAPTFFTSLRLTAPPAARHARPASHVASSEQKRLSKIMERSTNVFGQPLTQCSTQPMTGFFRDGYCNTSALDGGSHTLAAQVTPQFLSFSAERGNDLRSILSPGCKWCLCVSRWKEALLAYRKGQVGREAVPNVILPATHQLALRTVTLQDLQEFSVDAQSGTAASSSPAAPPSAGGPIR